MDIHARGEQAQAIFGEIEQALQAVVSLDADRALRRLALLVRATLRTNYFQLGEDGHPKPYISFKVDSLRPGRPAGAQALPRDLRLVAPGGGGSPALRSGGPGRPALERPARRLPHRGAGPGQGAAG
ncbi:MAG: NAD-glutamate dehydrogenase domain-containing protein [Caulobacteraceae bacterium]